MMKSGACGLCMLAEVRHAELQAEVARYRLGRQDASLFPTFSELLIAAARRAGHLWAQLTSARSRASSTSDGVASAIAHTASNAKRSRSMAGAVTPSLT